MPEWLIDLGVSALLRILKDKKQLQKFLPAVAKVYLAIDNAATIVPDLAAAIEKKRQEA